LDKVYQSDQFYSVVVKNSEISNDRCGEFSNGAKRLYAEYALKAIKSSETTFSTFDWSLLGACFAPNIPKSYWDAMNSTVFEENLSKICQKHVKLTSEVEASISTLAEEAFTKATDKAEFLFTNPCITIRMPNNLDSIDQVKQQQQQQKRNTLINNLIQIKLLF
jgi:hypothetical protein